MRSNFVFIYALFCIFAIFVHVESQTSNCSEKETCGECIQAMGCSWCTMRAFQGPRCGTQKILLDFNCDSARIEPSSPEIERQGDTRGKLSSSIFSPPQIRVRQKLGQKVNLSITFSFESKRSLDLYYVMDASCTMQVFRTSLTALAGDLISRLKDVAKDIRLGFGSFVDKPVLPFISDPREAQDGFRAPCGRVPIVGTYGFRNYLRLDADTEKFTQVVNSSKASGNYDLPEGGLDALLQAAVCKQQIGWREDTLRVLVLATDNSSSHITGDGKVGGIIKPHDGNCHLSAKQGYDEYSMSTELDYPSLALVNDKLRENGIRAIFATLDTSSFAGLGNMIVGSSIVALNLNQSRSIVDTVEEEMKRLVRTVELTEEESDLYRIKYYAKCNRSTDFVPGSTCSFTGGAKDERHTIEYMIEVEVLNCPPGGADVEQTIDISAIGFQPNLKILLTPACSCSCDKEQNAHHDLNEFCVYGTSKCGKCECAKGFCGRKCDKPVSNTTNVQCYSNGLCSGNGKCACGECKCNMGFLGSVCQYNRTQCPKGENGTICSGRGSCNAVVTRNPEGSVSDETLQCACHDGFGGSTCNCKSDTSNCTAPKHSSTCSGNGACKCNKCECKRGFSGNFCQDCHLVDSQEELSVNPDFRSCMDAKFSDVNLAFSSGSIIPCLLTHFDVEPIVNIAEKLADTNCNGEGSPCRLEVYRHPKTGCKHQFTVNCNAENSTRFIIHWNSYGTECHGSVNLTGVFIGVASAIVLIGIVTIVVWKLATRYYDKQEYLRFEKEKKDAQWTTDNNPLFVASTTMHMNPAYGDDEELEESGEAEEPKESQEKYDQTK